MEKNIRNQKGSRDTRRENVRPAGGERGASKTSATHRLYLKRMEAESGVYRDQRETEGDLKGIL